MSKALTYSYSLLALLIVAFPGRAGWGDPPLGYNTCSSCAAPDTSCGCETGCGHHGLLARLRDKLHSRDCCSCASPSCGCSTPCETPCRHPILERIRAKRAAACDCCNAEAPCRHHLLGFLHRDHGCCEATPVGTQSYYAPAPATAAPMPSLRRTPEPLGQPAAVEPPR